MATSYTTPNMSLVLPVPGSQPGPNWANDLNSSLTIVDAHSHVSGSGVQITPAAININTTLPMNGYTLSAVGPIVLATQASTPGNLSLYVATPDLYFVDGNGNNVKLTSGGAVNATSSGISSGTATASFIAGVLIVNSATNTPANIQGGSILIGNNVASSKFVTLSAPSALAANYGLVLPTLPAQTNVVTLDTSGNIGSDTYNNVFNSISASNAGPANTIFNAITAPSQAKSNLVGQAMNFTGADAIAVAMSTGGAQTVVNSATAGHHVVVSNTNATNNLAIVRGTVSSGGSPTGGEGFSSSRASAGLYNITFSASFADTPIITALLNTVTSVGGDTLFLQSASSSGFQIENFQNSGGATDAAFSFIAIGQV